jgi:hypothetical protein
MGTWDGIILGSETLQILWLLNHILGVILPSHISAKGEAITKLFVLNVRASGAFLRILHSSAHSEKHIHARTIVRHT